MKHFNTTKSLKMKMTKIQMMKTILVIKVTIMEMLLTIKILPKICNQAMMKMIIMMMMACKN